MTASEELQKLLIQTLRGDDAVTLLVGTAVYEEVPKSRPDPCIALGPSDTRNSRLVGVRQRDETVQIDVFSRSGNSLRKTKAIVGAIVDALEETDLEQAGDWGLENLTVELDRVFRVSGGTRGVVQVTAEMTRAL